MSYYNYITYEVLLLIMALGVINHFKAKKFNIVLSIASIVLTIFLCTIAFWWMVDTVVYLKWEVLKSPLISGAAREQSILPT
jgi:uncharacterized membrane protein